MANHKVVGKGYINTENSQVASIGAIFTSTYHTKQLNPWPNSSASCVVYYSQLSACQGKMEQFEDHPSDCRCLISLRNKLQQKQPGQLSVPIPGLRLRGRYSLFKIIFGGVIIVLANKSITTCSLTLLSVTVMI